MTVQEKTDKDLFEGIANNDQKCWQELVRRYANLIYLVSLRILNNNSDAEDATQNVFIKIQSFAKRANELESAINWIKTVATREALLILRQRRKQLRIKNFATNNIQEPDMAEEKNERIEDHTYLLGLLNTLPEKIKTSLTLHYLAEMTYEEIGQNMKVDKSTISRWIEKGLALINQKLKKEGMASTAIVMLLSINNRLKASEFSSELVNKIQNFDLKKSRTLSLNTKPIHKHFKFLLWPLLTFGFLTLIYVSILKTNTKTENLTNLNKEVIQSKIFFSFSKNKKWGIKTSDGKIVVEAKYDEIETSKPFREGLCRAKFNGKWGFIDEKGDVIIPFQYNQASFFAHGLTWVCDEKGWLINNKNEKLFGPYIAAGTGNFDVFKVFTYDNKELTINSKGEKIDKFDSLKYFLGFSPDGVAVCKKGNEVGLIYTDGTFKPIEKLKDLSINEIIHSGPSFNEGYCLLNLKNRNIIINVKGEIVNDSKELSSLSNKGIINNGNYKFQEINIGGKHYLIRKDNHYELRKILTNELVKTLNFDKKIMTFEMNHQIINLIFENGVSEILDISK